MLQQNVFYMLQHNNYIQMKWNDLTAVLLVLTDCLQQRCLIGFIKFNQKPIKNYGSAFLSGPFNFLIAKLWVDVRCSADCLRPNLITIWVDAQLQNCF